MSKRIIYHLFEFIARVVPLYGEDLGDKCWQRRSGESQSQVSTRWGTTLFKVKIRPLAWVLRQPGVSSAITGATRPTQVEDNARAADVKLSDDVAAQIEAILAE